MYQDTTLQPSAAYLWLDHHPSFTAARTQSDSTKFAINVCDSMTPEQALGVAATIEGWVRNNAAIIGDYTDSERKNFAYQARTITEIVCERRHNTKHYNANLCTPCICNACR